MNIQKYKQLSKKLFDNSPHQNWATIQRKLFRQPRLEAFSESHPCLFILSTGRVGTETMAALLEFLPHIFVEHEPFPKLFGLSHAAYMNKTEPTARKILIEAWTVARTDSLQYALACGKGYIETSPQATFLAPIISAAIPKAKFIHLIRDPADVVRSGMRRRWYAGNEADIYRITPRTGDPFHAQWETFTAVQRNAWLWAETNRWIMDFCQTLPERDHLLLKSEDIFNNDAETIAQLFDFIDASVPSQRKIRAVLAKNLNKQTKGSFSKEHIALGLDDAILQTFISKIAEQVGYQWAV